MGGGASQEKKEFAWCADERKTSPLFIAGDIRSRKDGLHMLGILSVAHKVPELDQGVLGEQSKLEVEKKLEYALKNSLPAAPSGDNVDFWILHFSPVILVGNFGRRREAYIAIDRTALYIVANHAGSRWVCGGGASGLEGVLRISLKCIRSISADDNREDFTISALIQLLEPCNNFFQWKDSNTTYSEKAMRLHSLHRAEVFRVLQGMLNVLYYSVPTQQRNCKWINKPEAVAALQERVHPAYEQQCATGCYEAKFLMHATFSPYADVFWVLPVVWAATPPPHLHVYRAFHKPMYGSKALIPRAPNGLYEVSDGYAVEPNSNPNPALWAGLQLHHRVTECPPYRLPSLTAACRNQLLTAGAESAPGVLDILSLHGSGYCASSNTTEVASMALDRTSYEPGYSIDINGAVNSGGLRWYAHGLGEARLVAYREIVQGALEALVHNRAFHTLSFARCVLAPNADLRFIFTAMADVCKYNSSLTSIDFPRHAKVYADGWRELSEALYQNQLPLFTSINAGGTHLDDASLELLLPSLLRLYDKAQLGLSPVSLCFADNRLTEAGVTQLCNKLLAAADLSHLQSISFGGSAWATETSATALIKLLRVAKSLQSLDVSSRDHTFPRMAELAAALAENQCPLVEFAVGGHALASTEAEAWVTAVAALAQAKKATLKKVSIRGVHLRAYLASRLIAALPSVELELSDDAVSYDSPGGNFQIDGESLVRELKIARNAYYVLHWWRVMPRCLVVLDLSDTQNTSGVQLFDALRDALSSLRAPIALQSVNCARLAAPADQMAPFKDFLEVLLLSEYVKVKSLDITGCRGGPYALGCLGNCLRKNRSLTSLKCDGQAPRSPTANLDIMHMPEGWKALRGCFYGNKKVRELSYPWCDVIEYFRAVALEVEKGWRGAASLKQQIGMAHRSCEFDRKSAIIQSLIALKRTFLGYERERCKMVQVLHDMFSAVEANASLAVELEERKIEAAWTSEKTDVLLSDLSTQQDGLLGQLWAQLMQFASSQPRPPPPPPTDATEPGPPPPATAGPASAASAPLPPAHSARGQPPATQSPGGSYSPPPGDTGHTTRRAWDEISRSIASGPQLFTPGEFQRFVALVHSVGGHKDPKLGKILKSADRLTVKATVKAAGYKRSPQRLATALKKSSPTTYSRYDFLANRDDSYDWYNYQNYVVYRETINVRNSWDLGNHHHDRDHHHNHGGHHDHDENHDGKDSPRGEGNNQDSNPPTYVETNEPVEPEPVEPADPTEADPAVDGAVDAGNAIQELYAGEDNPEGNGGVGGDEAGQDTVDDAVAMYAGAGPRDLPDGDPDQSHGPDAVRAGLRGRETASVKNRWLSSSIEIQPPLEVPRRETMKDLAGRLRKYWSEAVSSAVSQSADVLLRTLEYVSLARFATTSTSGRVNSSDRVCTLVTQCSVDRLDRLKKQARAWGGCLSAAVYISTASAAEKAAGLAAVQALVRELDEDETYSGALVVSVLYGHEDSPWLWDCTTPGAADGALYPINALRNLAASVVQSALVFLVDVDFVPSAGLEHWVQRAAVEQDLQSRCSAGELLVIPAFERMVAAENADSADAAELSLHAVCAGLEEGSVTAFHVEHFPAGHSPTNYAKWRELSAPSAATCPAAAYQVPYGDYYEPYVIMARSRFVAYDERFRGYGMNKCVHLRALAERGCTFHVLPGHFLVADAHEKSVAHQRTYGSQSGYRKHVVAAAYRAALRDIKEGKEPAVSRASARLLRQGGRKGSQAGVLKVKAMTAKTGVKKVMTQMLLAAKGELVGGHPGTVEGTA